ncbi:MAG: glycoside hydrolase [Lentimicrobium sp.]|nr:glycoside hydrolase [Lentimicrobium sp.]
MKRLILLFASLLLASSVFLLLFTGTGRRYVYKAKYAIFDKAKTTPAAGKIWGLDLSHHQKTINWNKVAEKKPHFIFFKATEGSTHKDTKYYEYVAQARKHNIITGAYHFFSYQSGGKAQAEHFCKTANLKKGDLPPVLDVEFKNNMPAKAWVTREILDWIKVVEKKYGVKPIIYCECDYFNKYIKKDLGKSYPLWISDFWREPRCNWTFWQKTDQFKIPGIKGTVDYNVFKGDEGKMKGLLIE